VAPLFSEIEKRKSYLFFSLSSLSQSQANMLQIEALIKAEPENLMRLFFIELCFKDGSCVSVCVNGVKSSRWHEEYLESYPMRSNPEGKPN